MRAIVCFLILTVWAQSAQAQEVNFRLAVPAEVESTGFLKHILPRFMFKTRVRIGPVAEGAPSDAQLTRGPKGIPVFQGQGAVWHLVHDGRKDSKAFEDWLRSEVGRRTIVAYAPDGDAVFSIPSKKVIEAPELEFDGNAIEGEKLALLHCGRCHATSAATRMSAIGSTPSFMVLRTLSNWQERFETFYVLNPHPAFTQIEDLTEDFDPLRPSPIVPVQMTLDDLEAILAFVAVVPPADLGAPIKHQ